MRLSGWNYAHWRDGVVCPPRPPAARWLRALPPGNAGAAAAAHNAARMSALLSL